MSTRPPFRLRVLNPSLPPAGPGLGRTGEGHGYAAANWLALLRVVGRMERRVNHTLADFGLTHSQFDVLINLRIGDGITQQELAERVLMTKGNICQVIDKLQQKQWVLRQADPVDRRMNRLYLTAEGKRLLAAAFPETNAMMQESMSILQESEQKMLFELLSRLDVHLRESERL